MSLLHAPTYEMLCIYDTEVITFIAKLIVHRPVGKLI